MDLKKIEVIAKTAAFISAAAIGFVGVGIIETVKLERLLTQWAKSQGELAAHMEISFETNKKLLKTYEQMLELLRKNEGKSENPSSEEETKLESEELVL